MWKRNLLFLGICVAGLTTLAANLMQKNRVEHAQKRVHPLPQDDSFRQTVARVNQEFRDHWQSRKLSPAARADDLTICRRLALGLAGTVPSYEEIRAIEHKTADQRIEWWLARLLEDRRHADYFGERFARAFVGTDDGPFLLFRRRRFRIWLSDEFHANRPYDQIARALLSEHGLWTDRPAVNFVTATLKPDDDNQPDPVKLAGRTSRAFLGMRIDCLTCHDDRLGNISLGGTEPRSGLQTDFHELASFFGQTRRDMLGIREKSGDYKVRYLQATDEAVVLPNVPFHGELLPPTGPRRNRLANWVTHEQNKPFSRAIVNRIWALLFGRPLVQPIDDIPLRESESFHFPPGLETLANDFVNHGHDLRRLINLIVATDVYQLESRVEGEVSSAQEDGWAVFPLSRLRPEQMAGAMLQACSLKTIDANANILFQLQRDIQLNEFVKRYGDMGEDEFTDRAGTVSQRLLTMNGDVVFDRTKGEFQNASTRLAVLVPENEHAVEATYLTVLTRRPTTHERRQFKELMATDIYHNQRQQFIEDLSWTLLNSTEFSWNH